MCLVGLLIIRHHILQSPLPDNNMDESQSLSSLFHWPVTAPQTFTPPSSSSTSCPSNLGNFFSTSSHVSSPLIIAPIAFIISSSLPLTCLVLSLSLSVYVPLLKLSKSTVIPSAVPIWSCLEYLRPIETPELSTTWWILALRRREESCLTRVLRSGLLERGRSATGMGAREGGKERTARASS